MNYELAKKLKDAGFPNKDCEDCIVNTTLSELIEACGDSVYYISRDAWKGWVASRMNSEDSKEEMSASTPEEAVANLWLALNDKEVV